MNRKVNAKQTMPYIVLFVVVALVLFAFTFGNTKYNTLTYNELLGELSKGNVTEITTTEHSGNGIYYITGKLEGYKKNEYFKTNAPLSETVQETLQTQQTNHEFKWTVGTNPENSTFMVILINFVPIIIIVGATIFLFARLSGSNKNSMDFGRSRAKLSEDGGRVRFKDVAGLEEEKQEEIINGNSLWIENFKSHKNITELDRDVVKELIDYIEVHENKKITIHFKFMDELNKILEYIEDENKASIFEKVKEA